jgi:adiponectin receptor
LVYDLSSMLLDQKTLMENYPWTRGRTVYDYVFTNYRKPCDSYCYCVASTFYLHNEWVNIWTHMVGFAVSSWMLWESLSHGNILHSLYSASSIVVFSSSVGFHIFNCHSDKVSRCVQCIDWYGIYSHVFFSTLLVSYYEFEGNYYYWIPYNTLSILCANWLYRKTLESVYSHENASDYAFRSCITMLYGSSSMLGWYLGHLLYNHYDTGVVDDKFYKLCMVYAYYGSIILCIFDFPEKYLPRGMVDNFGASHQWFHIGIICASTLLWKIYPL